MNTTEVSHVVRRMALVLAGLAPADCVVLWE